jgi:hypothetical protein
MLATESGVLVLLLVGVEQVRVVPGLMRASPLDFVSYPSSHGYGCSCRGGVGGPASTIDD